MNNKCHMMLIWFNFFLIIKVKRILKNLFVAVSIFVASVILVPVSANAATITNGFFGINGHPYGPYADMSVATQLDLVNQLGTGLYRLNITSHINYTMVDQYLAEGQKRGIKFLMTLNGPLDWTTSSASAIYTAAFNQGRSFATRYAGQIAAYGLVNEKDVETKLPGVSDGTLPSDYDDALYVKGREEIRGLHDGVKAGDPNAKTLVNFAWLHYGFIQRLLDDGVTFDIIGIDWYSDMGDITNVRGRGFDLVSYIKTHFGKPLWITEANRKYGSMNGNEAAQATYLSQTAQAMAKNPDVDAFIAYELFDEPGLPDVNEHNYGLVKFKQSGGKYVIDTFKPAFAQYQQVIASNTAPQSNPLADVVITSSSYANGVFMSTVKNQGSAATPAGTLIGVGYSVDGVWRASGSLNGPLAAGASVTIGTDGAHFTIPTGTHTFSAYVDDVNRFAESNETNNKVSNSITMP
ncbi:MAG: CARDB domain-containing protein [Methylococcales bacterium]|nr:CARDB domain-containing protein [Methylococcales bacterium]